MSTTHSPGLPQPPVPDNEVAFSPQPKRAAPAPRPEPAAPAKPKPLAEKVAEARKSRTDKQCRVTLALVMKNEAKSIATLIRSCANLAQHVYLYDTGSTDGTQALAKKVARELGMGCTVAQGVFEDFAQARNACLEGAEKIADFCLMLSGDERLDDDRPIFHAINVFSVDPDMPGAYELKVRLGSILFSSPRLFRSDAHLRYVGPAHEYVDARDWGLQPIHGVTVIHERPHDPEGMKRTWENHLRLLGSEVEKPDCAPRWVYYFGQTFDCLGRHAEAIDWYEKRIALHTERPAHSMFEEVFEAALKIARCRVAMDAPDDVVREAFLRAHRLSPHRAEPLYWCAEYLRGKGQLIDSALYAAGAYARSKTLPGDRLFVDAEIYAFKAAELCGIVAWYAGDFETGFEAAKAACAKHPEVPHLVANVEHYRKRLGR